MDPHSFRFKYYDKLTMAKTSSAIITGTHRIEEVKKSESEVKLNEVSPNMTKSIKDDNLALAEGERLVNKFEDPNNEGFSLNYIERTAHSYRMKYLHSLASKKIWIPISEKPKTHQTGIKSS